MGRFAFALFLLLALGPASSATANPWVKEKGEGEAIANSTIYRQEAGLAGGAAATASSDFHLEYGADARASIIADASVQQYVAAGQSVSAFDTAWLGLRAGLMRWDNSVFSAEIHAGASGIREEPSPGSRISLDGTGEARLMFGEGFDVLNRHAFAGIEGGWRWRGGPPADEFVLDTIVGIAPWQSALLMLQSFAIVGAGPARGAYRRYDLVKLQLSLAQQLTPRWWLQAGIIGAVAGTDAGDAGAVVALWWRF